MPHDTIAVRGLQFMGTFLSLCARVGTVNQWLLAERNEKTKKLGAFCLLSLLSAIRGSWAGTTYKFWTRIVGVNYEESENVQRPTPNAQRPTVGRTCRSALPIGSWRESVEFWNLCRQKSLSGCGGDDLLNSVPGISAIQSEELQGRITPGQLTRICGANKASHR